MARVSTTIAGLGRGLTDGEAGILRLAGGDLLRLWWWPTVLANPTGAGQWRSKERDTFRNHSVVMEGRELATYTYLYRPAGIAGSYNRIDAGWEPQHILNAADCFAAGLTVQEQLSAVFKGNGQLATVLYPFSTGSEISGAINPASYVSTVINGTGSVVWTDSGWVNSPFTTATVNGKSILACHLYTKVSDGTDPFLYAIKAKFRWVGAVA